LYIICENLKTYNKIIEQDLKCRIFIYDVLFKTCGISFISLMLAFFFLFVLRFFFFLVFFVL